MERCVTKYLIIFSVFVLNVSCSQKDIDIQYIENNIKSNITNDIEKIYIINENSVICDKCFNIFIDYVERKELNQKELLIVNNTKNLIDIEQFKSKKNTFVIHDYDLSLKVNLGVIYTNNLKIDSVFNVIPENVFDFISNDSSQK